MLWCMHACFVQVKNWLGILQPCCIPHCLENMLIKQFKYCCSPAKLLCSYFARIASCVSVKMEIQLLVIKFLVNGYINNCDFTPNTNSMFVTRWKFFVAEIEAGTFLHRLYQYYAPPKLFASCCYLEIACDCYCFLDSASVMYYIFLRNCFFA